MPADLDTVVLYEHTDSDPIQLSLDERDGLAELVPKMMITPEPGHEDVFLLNPGNQVGAIQLEERRFELRPKIGIRRLTFVLAYSMDPSNWRQSGFDFEEEADLFEAIIPGFAFQVEEALRGGPLLGYRPEEDALQTVRGRIRFDDQLRYRFGILPPIECRFDEFTEDIEVNRLLKAATEGLGRIRIRSAHSRKRLRTLRSAFTNVASVIYDPRRVPEISWNRLNQRFRSATELARLVLRSRSFELRGGDVGGAAFLLNMSTVFEDFVVTALREALGLNDRIFPQQARGRRLYLDRGELPRLGPVLRLEPDLSWWDGDRCVFVGDAKYKVTPETSGVKNPDVYQLLAYTTATDLSAGILIYAAGEAEERSYRISGTGKRFEVRTLDLDQEPDQVLEQISRIAARIRVLRGEARDLTPRAPLSLVSA